MRRVGGGHHDDDVTFRRTTEGEVVRKYTRRFIRLDDNGWLSGLLLSPNRCAKTLNRVESLP